AALAIGVAESRQIAHVLPLGVDRLAPALGIGTPVRNEPPAQRVERYLPRLAIAANDQQILARRAVPPRRIVVHAAVARIHAIDDGIAQRAAALDDPPTHGVGYSGPDARLPARYRFQAVQGRISIGVPFETALHISRISSSVTAMHPVVQSIRRCSGPS